MALRYTRNTGGHLSHRVSLVTGDEPIRASLPGLPAGSAPSSICSIAAQAADAIRIACRPHVEPNFLSGAALQEARRASEAMLTKQAADKMATAPPLLRIVAAVEAIRQALADATGPTLEARQASFRLSCTLRWQLPAAHRLENQAWLLATWDARMSNDRSRS